MFKTILLLLNFCLCVYIRTTTYCQCLVIYDKKCTQSKQILYNQAKCNRQFLKRNIFFQVPTVMQAIHHQLETYPNQCGMLPMRMKKTMDIITTIVRSVPGPSQ